jgi:hypothetical protein
VAMTRKHFESLARGVRDLRQQQNGAPVTLTEVIEMLVDVCNEHSGISLNGNKLFDEDRFRDACWK